MPAFGLGPLYGFLHEIRPGWHTLLNKAPCLEGRAPGHILLGNNRADGNVVGIAVQDTCCPYVSIRVGIVQGKEDPAGVFRAGRVDGKILCQEARSDKSPRVIKETPLKRAIALQAALAVFFRFSEFIDGFAGGFALMAPLLSSPSPS